METVERTLIIVKPDGVQRAIVGRILGRFERAGFQIVALKMTCPSQELIQEHYADHKEEEFFQNLVSFMANEPAVAGVVEGVEAISVVRKLIGDTEPKNAQPGTIRGDFAHVSYTHADGQDSALKNVVHASANTAEAIDEISLWFDETEVYKVSRCDQDHVG